MVLWCGILAESKSFLCPGFSIGLLLTKSELSNEVQNFLYLSQGFDSSHATEGKDPIL